MHIYIRDEMNWNDKMAQPRNDQMMNERLLSQKDAMQLIRSRDYPNDTLRLWLED